MTVLKPRWKNKKPSPVRPSSEDRVPFIARTSQNAALRQWLPAYFFPPPFVCDLYGAARREAEIRAVSLTPFYDGRDGINGSSRSVVCLSLHTCVYAGAITSVCVCVCASTFCIRMNRNIVSPQPRSPPLPPSQRPGRLYSACPLVVVVAVCWEGSSPSPLIMVSQTSSQRVTSVIAGG